MGDICSQCGKEIKTREPFYTGIREDQHYWLHPECRAAWIDSWAVMGEETQQKVAKEGSWKF